MSVIGIDIDDTLAKYTHFIAPDIIEEPDPRFVAIVLKLYNDEHQLYAWSCRATHVVKKWLQKHDLLQYFNGVNVHPNTVSDSPKPSFDYYIGDEAVQWRGDNAEEVLAQIAFKHSRCATERDNDFMSAAPMPYLAGTGRGYLDMFEQDWRRLWVQRDFGDRKKIAFLTICSHAKPYSKSHIHSMIRRRLHQDKVLHELEYIHISNAGIIPSGAEMTYPFNAYDHDGSQMSDEVAIYFSKLTEQRVLDWAKSYSYHYSHFVVYLRRGKTWAATYNALRYQGIQPIMVEALTTPENIPQYVALPDADDCLIGYDNLHNLSQAIRECLV